MTMNDNSLPEHVAIIMDGNRRWAKKRGLPAVAGHRKVVEDLLERLIEHAGDLDIPYITFWAFSTENWNRSESEITAIMKLFRWALRKKVDRLIEKGARLRIIGDQSRFPDDIREGFESAVERSKDNGRITVTFALNYGGRDEMLRAMRSMMQKIPDRLAHNNRQTVEDDKFSLDSLENLSNEVLEHTFSSFLDTAGIPDPDFVIRTGGEQRLSGFMLWQVEYAELYFPETLMPDFDEDAFDVAMQEFAQRKRRFGK